MTIVKCITNQKLINYRKKSQIKVFKINNPLTRLKTLKINYIKYILEIQFK